MFIFDCLVSAWYLLLFVVAIALLQNFPTRNSIEIIIMRAGLYSVFICSFLLFHALICSLKFKRIDNSKLGKEQNCCTVNLMLTRYEVNTKMLKSFTYLFYIEYMIFKKKFYSSKNFISYEECKYSGLYSKYSKRFQQIMGNLLYAYKTIFMANLSAKSKSHLFSERV